ncbi:histone-lysine N-methyltransferase ATXR2-like [Zingiber officinale]|uniref:histone-lysine N-methyltransferase ATXR2-like n=1 Tax=Zingiber officinale TaxID=94328 RepID=UPI001C4BAB5D|nr:histone-lysine N-methyltransferase ATXR2-like [Zingiber officinale]
MEGGSRSPCPLDMDFSTQIAALLSPPSAESVKDYYAELIAIRKCPGLKINFNNDSGKAVFSVKEFEEGELVLKDPVLVAAQHTTNKVDCLVCSHCFRFIGSVELQIGRKLILQDLGLTDDNEKDCTMASHNVGTDSLFDRKDDTSTSTYQNLKKNYISGEVLESLVGGKLSLPFSSIFSLPSVFDCPGGCKEEHYCSKSCADSDWEFVHSILCTGRNKESSQRDAMLKFIEHANSTNDIFILAAKVISFVILRFKKLKQLCLKKNEKCTKLVGIDFPLLLEAWKPVSMGFKKRWWDCIALPDDVDASDEQSFRMQIRDLAYTSLLLLKKSIFEDECAPLFSLEIYGHIIGMFELNNLDLVVASPIEDYFIYIDELPSPDKEEAEKLTRPFLESLGDEYSVCCQGTGFYPIQSCMNHSCLPNAKAFKRDEDKDGQAVIIAVRPILEGEEITISYIDEDLPYEERQALLADYGFKCMCPRCVEEMPNNQLEEEIVSTT